MSGTLGSRAALPNPEGGCRIAAFLLGDVERLETALAAYMVMAWRINRLMRLGRSLPRLAASLLFEKKGGTAAYALNRKVPTKKEPKQGEVIRLIKQLGGCLGRKRDGEPGAKTLWRGLYVMSPSRSTSCRPFGMGRFMQ